MARPCIVELSDRQCVRPRCRGKAYIRGKLCRKHRAELVLKHRLKRLIKRTCVTFLLRI